jgi:RNA polymerase sigma-70 factor (ECF subfamily)
VERVSGQPSGEGPAEVLVDPEAAARAALDAGDRRGALEILMRVYGAGVYRFCRSTLEDGDLAQEVHQIVFVAAYDDLGSFAGRSTLQAWLYGIARHRCLDALKSRRRARLRMLFGLSPPEGRDARPGPAELLERRGLGQALQLCLKALAPHVRMAVLLRYGEGLSCEDISRTSGERANTVQARVARALIALRRCLESNGVTP